METIRVTNVDEYDLQCKKIIEERKDVALHFVCDTRNTTDMFYFEKDEYRIRSEDRRNQTLIYYYKYGHDLPYLIMNDAGNIVYQDDIEK